MIWPAEFPYERGGRPNTVQRVVVQASRLPGESQYTPKGWSSAGGTPAPTPAARFAE